MNNHFKTGILLLVIALSAVTILGMNASTQQPTTLIWSIPDHARDIAVSDSGGVIAVASYDPVAAGDFVKIFNSNGNMLWSWQPPPGYTVTAIDISGSGSEVAAAIYDSTTGDSRILFWKNARNLRGTPEPNWNSTNLYGPIGMHALALSDDGNHLVAVGTGPNIFYWNNTKSMSGGDQAETWGDAQFPWNLEYVSISNDGDELVASGVGSYLRTQVINVYYYRNSTHSIPALSTITIYGVDGLPVELGGTSLSGDGDHFVVGAYTPSLGSSIIYYYQYDPQCESLISFWAYPVEGEVVDVDINWDGSIVVAAINNATTSQPLSVLVIDATNIGTECILVGGAGIRGNDLLQAGIDSEANILEFTEASSYTTYGFTDVAVDDSGSIVAAGTGDYVFSIDASAASLIWSYGGEYPLVSSIVEVSGEGNYIVSGGAAIDSIYFFLSTPPSSVGGVLVEPDHIPDGAVEPGVLAIVLASSMAVAGAIALWYTRRV